MMADSTDTNNLEQNILYRITAKHTWRKTAWTGKKRKKKTLDQTKPVMLINQSCNDEQITQHETFLCFQDQIYELNLKIPKCLQMDVEHTEQT